MGKQLLDCGENGGVHLGHRSRSLNAHYTVVGKGSKESRHFFQLFLLFKIIERLAARIFNAGYALRRRLDQQPHNIRLRGKIVAGKNGCGIATGGALVGGG